VITPAQRERSRVDKSEAIVQTVQKCLEGSAHTVLRTVSVSYERGVLFLRGRLPSYFHKQLAQEAVRRIDGVARIVNEIEVPIHPFRQPASGQQSTDFHHTHIMKETAI